MRSLLLVLFLCVVSAGAVLAETVTPVQLTLDTSEADQALAILAKKKAHIVIDFSNWQKLFVSLPSIALKARKAAIGRPLTDKVFLLSPAAQDKKSESHSQSLRHPRLTALSSSSCSASNTAGPRYSWPR